MNYHQNQVNRIGSRIIGGTSGSVLWVDSNLRFAQDNANFFWDASNTRLGIGAAPSTKLHATGTSAPTVVLRVTGAVGQSVNYLDVLDSSSNVLLALASTGRLRVNTASVVGTINASPINVTTSAYNMTYSTTAWGGGNNTTGIGLKMVSTISDTTNKVGTVTHNRIFGTSNNLVGSSTGLEVLSYISEDSSTGGGTTTAIGLAFFARSTGATQAAEVYGLRGLAECSGTGGVQNMYSVYTQGNLLAGCGAITNYYGYYSTGIFANASGTTNAYSLYAAALSTQGAGVITNLYGLYIETPISGGTLNYALYAAGGSSVHVGKFSIGGATAPAAMVHIQGAGTAAAALRIASGAAPTSPQTGDTWNDSTTNLLEFRHSSGTNVSLIESSDFTPMLLMMGG